MDKKEIIERGWRYIADHDEDAKVIPDGNIIPACELIADFIENLIDNGVLAEPIHDASALPIPGVSISVCPKCHASEVYENMNGDGECAVCGHIWQTGR